MLSASIQTDRGHTLLIKRSDGRPGGKPILAFLMSTLRFCEQRTRPRDPFDPPGEFDRLPESTHRPLCLAAGLLVKSLINSRWDYVEGEDYTSYVRRTHDAALSCESFEAGAEHFRRAWTDVDLLIARVQTVMSILYRTYLSEDAACLGYDVLLDFTALYEALVELQENGVRQARIDIH